MTDIAAFSTNPSIDISTSVDRVIQQTASKLHCAAAQRDPGVGGINVAGVVRRLGAHVINQRKYASVAYRRIMRWLLK